MDSSIVEVFCVDISRSMGYSQTFPYIVGKSKLQTAKDLISHPAKDSRGQLLNNYSDIHFSSLVTFCALPQLVVPFGKHDTGQVKKIVSAINSVSHVPGTAIYSAISYCERLILEFTMHPSRKNKSWHVLLHVFSDGDDNASDELRKQELHTEKDCILQRSASVHHRFLYNFNSDASFQRVKTLGENLGATVIFVKTDDLKRNIEERDKVVFRTLAEFPKKNIPKKKTHKGWNMLKGDKPDLVLLHKQLQKADKVFQGDFLKTEGIFRENANFRCVDSISSKLALGTDTLEDYTDPILTSHALKNLLHHYEIIPRNVQVKLLGVFATSQEEKIKFNEISAIFRTLPELNLACLNLVITILRRVVEAQHRELPPTKALTTTGVSLIFSTIFLGQVDVQSREVRQSKEIFRNSREKEEGESMSKMVLMSQCVAYWIENGNRLFGEFG